MAKDGFYYSIRKGDTLSDLASRYKLPGWRAIYDHASNADFRKLRPNPNKIEIGDRIWIPSKLASSGKSPSGGCAILVKKNVVEVQITVKDKTNGDPIKGARVTAMGAEFFKGLTNDRGVVILSRVPSGDYLLVAEYPKYFSGKVNLAVAGERSYAIAVDLRRVPHFASYTTNNEIFIKFNPDNSEKVKKCKKIVHVQFVRKYVDSKVIKPGDWASQWTYRNRLTTAAGWGVDCLASETTPDYQQGNGNGKKNGGSKIAEIYDAPKTSNGDKMGFYHPTTKPDGVKLYRNEFATFAYCMEGDECGTWYEGITWTYRKTWQEMRDGKIGVSTITNYNVAAPSQSHLDAFDKFNEEKGFVPCE